MPTRKQVGSFLRGAGSVLSPRVFQSEQQRVRQESAQGFKANEQMLNFLAEAAQQTNDPEVQADIARALQGRGAGGLTRSIDTPEGVSRETIFQPTTALAGDLKPFDATSATLGRDFTAFTDKQGNLMMREAGELIRAPEDTIKRFKPSQIVQIGERFKSKVMQKKFEAIDENGVTGLNTMRRLDELRHLSAQGLDTGRFEEFKLETAKVLEGLGMDNAAKAISNVRDAETFRKIAGSTVLDGLRQFQLYPVSNVDLREVKGIFPSLTTTEQANAFVMRSLKEGAFGSVMKKRIADEAFSKFETPSEIQREVNKWDRIFESPSFRRFYVAGNGKPIWFNEYYNAKLEENPNLTLTEIATRWRTLTK